MVAAVDRSRGELEKAQFVCRQREAEFRASSEAADLVKSVREMADRHTEVLGKLKELEKERLNVTGFAANAAK